MTAPAFTSVLQTEPTQLLVIALVVLLSGISKSGFAGALGAFSVPLLLLVMNPKNAIALMLPLLIVADVFSLKSYWKLWHYAELKRLLPGTFVGIALATVFLQGASEFWLTVAIAGLSVAFGVRGVFFRHNKVSNAKQVNVLAGVTGTLAGISTTLIHAGGPPLMVYFNSRAVSTSGYIATVAVIFALMNVVKLVTFSATGLLQLEHVLLALCFIPVAMLGNKLGIMIAAKLAPGRFVKVMNALLILLGIALIIKLL